MNKLQLETLKNELGLELSSEVIEKFSVYEKLFLDYNSHTNLMSKGDLALLFEKHIFDSLAFVLTKSQDGKKKILDIGTGGGFPSLVLAICFENLEIVAVDSIAKKINFIALATKELDLKNIKPVCSRSENLSPQGVDIITSRAVGKMVEIYKNSKIHIKKGGKFVFYKADPKVYKSEIVELQSLLGQKINPKVIKYALPTPELHARALIIV